MDETHRTHLGKWSQTGIPHKGWTCVGVEDLEEKSQLCKMCETSEIRYVHYMRHPDYPDTLGVGCICAEHMENDYVNPRIREQRLRSLARRRRSWSERHWSLSAKGNPYLNTEGFNLTVFPTDPRGQSWRVRVTNRTSGASQAGHRCYVSVDAAKRAALDALVWAKDHLRG